VAMVNPRGVQRLTLGGDNNTQPEPPPPRPSTEAWLARYGLRHQRRNYRHGVNLYSADIRGIPIGVSQDPETPTQVNVSFDYQPLTGRMP